MCLCSSLTGFDCQFLFVVESVKSNSTSEVFLSAGVCARFFVFPFPGAGLGTFNPTINEVAVRMVDK